eukprot:332201-Pyramimonas_sp.AAC.1
MEHYNTAHYTSTAEISTHSMACSTHSNLKHLGPRLLQFSLCLYDQMVTRVGLELSWQNWGAVSHKMRKS